MDEVRIWKTALTQAQIRDRMCRKITSGDALYPSLVAYFNFDETSGTTVYDGTADLNNGTLNGPTRITSGAAIGNTSIHNYVTSGLPATNLSYIGQDNLNVSYTSGTYTGEAGTHVYAIGDVPNTTTGVTGVGRNDRYFGVYNVNLTTPQYTATYNYTGNPYVGAVNETTLALYKRTDNAATAWSNCSATLNTTANTLTVTGQSTEYILGSTGVPLPLTLLSFTGSADADGNMLKWETAQERNTEAFSLEMSTDGKAFTTIGMIAAQGNGSANYQYRHSVPENQTDFLYRLRMIDKGGSHTFSNTIHLVRAQQSAVSFLPNPVKSQLLVTGLKEGSAVRLFSIDGKLLTMVDVISTSTFIDMHAYQPGIYVLEYLNNGSISRQKIVKE
jgi:hypothetical protein